VTNLEAARQTLGVYTAGSFDLWGLAGAAKASCRAHIMAKLLGKESVPQSKAGVNAVAKEFCTQAGVTGSCKAELEEAFRNWCKNYKEEKPKIVDQAKLDELVWQHGDNIPAELTAELVVNDEMLALAQRRVSERLKDSLKQQQKEPKQGFVDAKARPLGGLAEGDYFVTPDFKLAVGGVITGRRGRKIEDCGGDVKVEVDGKVTTWSSATMVIRKTKEALDETQPGGDNSSDPILEIVMEVNEKDGRLLLKAVGVPAVDKMSQKKLAVKLNELPQLLEDGATRPEDEGMSKLLNQIEEALTQGGSVELIEEGESNLTTKSTKKERAMATVNKTKATNGKPKAKDTNGKSNPAGGGAEKDRFGSRVGTVRAIFNAALSGKPRTAAELAEEIKAKTKQEFAAGRIHSYLLDLSKRDKRVEHTEKGWKATK
jgi:hypothetical protein